MSAQLEYLSVGLPAALPYRGGSVASGFVKTPVSWAVELGPEGLLGDGQADCKHHGGPEKAVCVYPLEHYPYWQERLGIPLGFAAFGENFTTCGLTEQDVCVGDVFEIGEVIVQVSQPRQPCFKLAARHAEPKLTLWVQDSGFTGWYFRVLEVGAVRAGLRLRHLHRPEGAVTVAEANRVMHHDKHDFTATERLLVQEALSTSWRATLEKRLQGQSENTAARLAGTKETT